MAGISFGHRLIGASSSNPRGHYDDRDFVNLHERQLRAYRLRGSGLLLRRRIPTTLDKEHFTLASSLTAERSAEHDCWAWKDPRGTLFLQAWLQIVPSMHVIAVYRRPELVVDSLIRRVIREVETGNRGGLARMALHSLGERYLRYRFNHAYCLYNEQLLTIVRSHKTQCVLVDADRIEDEYPLLSGSISRWSDHAVVLPPLHMAVEPSLLTRQTSAELHSSSTRSSEIFRQLKAEAQSQQS